MLGDTSAGVNRLSKNDTICIVIRTYWWLWESGSTPLNLLTMKSFHPLVFRDAILASPPLDRLLPKRL